MDTCARPAEVRRNQTPPSRKRRRERVGRFRVLANPGGNADLKTPHGLGEDATRATQETGLRPSELIGSLPLTPCPLSFAPAAAGYLIFPPSLFPANDLLVCTTLEFLSVSVLKHRVRGVGIDLLFPRAETKVRGFARDSSVSALLQARSLGGLSPCSFVYFVPATFSKAWVGGGGDLEAGKGQHPARPSRCALGLHKQRRLPTKAGGNLGTEARREVERGDPRCKSAPRRAAKTGRG